MTGALKREIRALLRRAGVDVVRVRHGARAVPPDFDSEKAAVVDRVAPHTMTSPERIGAVVDAVRYVDRFEIPGALVECGVWRGGSSMAAALTHQAASTEPSRSVYLYDTFEGMPPPSEADIELNGRSAADALAVEDRDRSVVWAVAGLDVVKRNMETTGYPSSLIQYVPGRIEDVVPATVPGAIAVLRLDTDWYESTRHELIHLVPLVTPGGVLIIDDYGHWQGARSAVDEWLAATPRPILLNRIDYTGRIGVLP